MLLLLAGALIVTWVLNRNASNDRFNDYIAELTESGQPLQVDEIVNRCWSLPKNVLDTTREWQSTITDFSESEYRDRITNMQLVGDQIAPMWPPGKWRDFERASMLLSDYREQLIRLQLATHGYGMLESDYQARPQLAQEDLDALWRAFDFLELACYAAAHERDQEELVGRIMACLSFSNCLRHHPGHLADRAAFDVRAFNLLIRAVSRVQFDEAELSQFRDRVLEKDYWQPIRDYWRYQRAVRLLMYNDLDAFRETAVFRQMQDDPENADFIRSLDTSITYSTFSGDDAIRFLELMNSFEDSLQGNPVKAHEALADLESAAGSPPQGMDRYRQATAHKMIPSIASMVESSTEVQAYQQVALAILAVDHFRVSNNRFPDSLDEAMKGFLENEPMDWYVDKPIRTFRENNEFQVMSVGRNGIDNKLGQDDIGGGIPIEKWNANAGPVERID